MEEIKELNAMMTANDWRDRYKAITTLLEMCEINENLVSTHVVKVTNIIHINDLLFKFLDTFGQVLISDQITFEALGFCFIIIFVFKKLLNFYVSILQRKSYCFV